MSGSLQAEVHPDGRGLSLSRPNGETVLNYSGLTAYDATGKEFPARMRLVGCETNLQLLTCNLQLLVDDAGAAYPLTIDPWVQQAKLTAFDGATDDEFGVSVAVSGDTAVIGSWWADIGPPPANDQGAAYVFTRFEGFWTLEQKLTADEISAGECGGFGWSVAISGDTAVIGAKWSYPGNNYGQGAAYVFTRSGGFWTQQAHLTANDGAAGDEFGFSVAVSGDTAVIGAPKASGLQGTAYVFTAGTNWTQQAKLTAADGAAFDQFGMSVAISGGTAVIVGGGAAYVFTGSGLSWTQQTTLTAGDGAGFYGSVAIDGDTAVIAAPWADVGGAAYVFTGSGATWGQQAKLTAGDGAANDVFGRSVAISGDTAVIGADRANVGFNNDQGAAYVFTRSGAAWTEQAKLTADDGGADDWFGTSVAISGYTAVIGAKQADVDGSWKGAAYTYILEHTLSVHKDGPGSGEVVDINDYVIDCGEVCSATYSPGTEVLLEATPDYPWQFIEWSGACTGSNNPCGFTITDSQDVTATFSLSHTLAVTVTGAGSGVIASTPPGITCASGLCESMFVMGTLVSLVATPALTSTFAGWGGACSGDGACELLMDEDKGVSGEFKFKTALTVTAHLPDPSLRTQPVVVSYTVSSYAGGPPTGADAVTVTLSNDPATCSGPAPGGSCLITPTIAGTHVLTATYAGDDDFDRSWNTVTHTVSKFDTVLAVTADTPDPSVTGQSVVVSFTVTSDPPGGGTPSGAVTVEDGDGNSCAGGTVAQGYCVITPTLAGSKTFSMTYAGDAGFNGSQISETHVVNTADTQPEITAITPAVSLPNESLPNEPLTINYTVAASPPGSGAPTGDVSILDSGGNNCAGTVAEGACVITPTLARTYTLTITYAGDANYNGSVASDGFTVIRAPTLVTITAYTPDSAPKDEPVVVSYTVAAELAWTGVPTGAVTVTLYRDTAQCTSTVVAGSCVLTPTLAQGTVIQASYGGNYNFEPGADSAIHLVTGAEHYTAITITAHLPNPSLVGQSVTVSYTVAPTATTTLTPTGEVIVLDDDGNRCIGDVDAGACVLQLSSPGAKTLSVIYTGDDNFNGSQTTAPHTIQKTDTTTALTAHLPDPSVMGEPVTVHYHVTANPPGSGTPTGAVTVSDGDGNSCTGQVSTGSCTLTPTQPGEKTLTAVYAGNSNFNSSQGSADHDVYDVPIADLVAQTGGTVALGQPTVFNAAISAGTNVEYTWDFGDGALPVTTNLSSITHTYDFVRVYTVTLMASNRGSAAAAATLAVVEDVPIAGLTAQTGSSAALLGATVAFTANVSAGSNVAYTWDFGDGSPIAGGQTVQHIYAELGTYTPVVTAANGTSSAVVSSAPVNIVSQITGLTAGSSSPTRYGQPTVFTSAVASGVGVVYYWDFGDDSTVLTTTDSVLVYVYPAGGDYSATVTADNGASSQEQSLSVAIEDDHINGLSVVSSDPTAVDTPTYFTATVLAGSSVVYTWDFGDGSTALTTGGSSPLTTGASTALSTGASTALSTGGSTALSGVNVQHTYDPPQGITETVVYNVSITASNSEGQVTATTEVNVYFTPPQTRQIGEISLTAGRFRAMGNGVTRATGMLMFAGGKMRLTGSDAIVYYTASTLTLSGMLELHSSSRAFKVGSGSFRASPRTGIGRLQGALTDGFTQLSGFDISGMSVTRIDLMSALIQGTATAIDLSAPGVTTQGSIRRFTVTVLDDEINVSGMLNSMSFDTAGSQLFARLQLTTFGVTAARASLTLPAALGSRRVSASNLRLTPSSITLDPVSLPYLRGATVRTSNATAQLLPASGGKHMFKLNGTLNLLLPQNRHAYAFSGTLDDAGRFRATISNVKLGVSSLNITLPSVTFQSLNDGIAGDMGILQLPSNLGGSSATLGNVVLDANGLRVVGVNSFPMPNFTLANGTFTLRDASAEVSVAGRGMALKVSARMDALVPGWNNAISSTLDIDPSGQFSGKVRDLSLPVAFLLMRASSGTIRPDGTLYVKQAVIEIPAALGLGIAGAPQAAIYNVTVDRGGLHIGGGGFALPDIRMTGFKLVGLGGKLIRTRTGYDIGAQGGFQMLDIPGQTGPAKAGCNGIWVALTLGFDTSGRVAINMMPVAEAPRAVQGITGVQFREAQLKVFCGIPIDATGFSIVEIRGTLNLSGDESRISLGMTIAAGAAIGGVYPIWADADATVYFSPFKLAFLGTVKVFVISVGGVGFEISGGSFYAKLWIDIVVASGDFSIRAWSDRRGFSFTASARVTIGIRKGRIWKGCIPFPDCGWVSKWWGGYPNCWMSEICLSIPPVDLILGSRVLEGGRFSNGSWGFRGYVTVLGKSYGIFISSKLDFKIGNVSRYKLMTPYTVAAARREMALRGVNSVDGLAQAADGDITQDVTLGHADSATFSLNRIGETPTLTLRTPHGVVITPGNLPGNVDFYEVVDYALESTSVATTTAEYAGFRFAHAAPGSPAVNVVIDGSHVFTTTLGPLTYFEGQAFGDVTEYALLQSGTAQVSIVRADQPATELLNAAISLPANGDYTLALIQDSGTLALTQVLDQNNPLPAGEAKVRLVNLLPITQTLELHHESGLQLVADVAYQSASDYVPLESGASNLTVYGSQDFELLATASNDAAQNDNVYSVFVLPPADGETTPHTFLHRDTTGQARVRFINAGPGRAALDLRSIQSVNGDTYNTALFEDVAYVETTHYLVVDSGDITAMVTPVGESGTVLAAQALTLEHNQDYTIIVADDGGGGHTLLLLEDNNAIPDAGIARLRLVNVGSTEALTLTSAFDDPTFFTGVAFNTASDYTVVSGGAYRLDLWDTGGWLLFLTDELLRDGQVYTAIAFAQAGGEVELLVFTDLETEKTVQTMYVVDKPEAGTWQATLGGNPQPEDQYIFSVIGTSPAPVLEDVALAHTPGDEEAQLSWRLTTHEPDTRLGVYANSGPLTYTEVITDPNSAITETVVITNYTGAALAYNLTLTDTGWIANGELQEYTVDVSSLPSGEYRVWMDVDDNLSPPLRVYATQILSIPVRPWSSVWNPTLTATPGMRSIDVGWTAHPDPDVDRYALEVSGPTISGTSVITVGHLFNTALMNLNPNEPYTITALARNGLSGQIARSPAVVVTPQGAPLALAAADGGTLNLEIGQSEAVALTLSTSMSDYPEPVALTVGSLPAGLMLDVPTALFTPTIAGTTVSVVVTVTEYMTHGTHLAPIVANGIGESSELSLTIQVGGPELSVNLAGTGAGIVASDPMGIDCQTDCSEIYNTGAVVTLTAVAEPDSVFGGWNGDVESTANPLQVTMDGDMDVTATFSEERPSSTTIYLPLISKSTVSAPDLVVVEGSLVATSNAVTMTIQNQGNVAVSDEFWVDVYFNPSQTPSLNHPWDTIASHGATWGVTTDIQAGGVLTLTTGGDYYVPEYSSQPPLPVGANVYALVDSVDYSTTYGAVQESNEDNNLTWPVVSTAGAAGVDQGQVVIFLPAIHFTRTQSEGASGVGQGQPASLEGLPPR